MLYSNNDLVTIRLTFNHGFEWVKSGNIFVKGYAYYQNQILKGADLASLFTGVRSESEFTALLTDLNGLFAIVIQHDDYCAVAMDRCRTFPLFFALKGDELFITDRVAETPVRFHSAAFNKPAMIEYSHIGIVSGNETLLDNVSQVQAGEYYWGSSAANNWKGKFYAKYLAEETVSLSYSEYEQQLLSCLDRVFARLVGSIDKKQTIILPLSGGYDSRLIAVMLKKNGYENVICYTFGKRGSFETINSEKIAAKLGYAWHFVATTYQEMDNFVTDKTFHEYIDFAANYSSFPIMQDYFAVKKLKEGGVFPDKAVVIPGHSGAVVGALL